MIYLSQGSSPGDGEDVLLLVSFGLSLQSSLVVSWPGAAKAKLGACGMMVQISVS